MCSQLEEISRAAGVEVMIAELAPEYLELLNDEEDAVREAACTSLLALGRDFLDEEQKRSLLISNFMRMCETPSKILPGIAKLFGEFMLHTKDLLDDTEIRVFMNAYLEMSVSSLETLRDPAAYNFPVFGNALITS